MLAKLLARFRPLRTEDPVFGPLRFQRVGTWEGHVQFAPTQSAVEILLDGGLSGPTEAQRHFFSELSARYPSLTPILREALTRRFAAIPERSLEASAEAFTLVCIGLPEDPYSSSPSELSFEGSASHLHFTVALSGWSPGHVELSS